MAVGAVPTAPARARPPVQSIVAAFTSSGVGRWIAL